MINTSIKVRKAVASDYKSISVISRDDLGYLCDENLVKTKLSMLDSRRECVFVAELDHKVIGYVHVEKYDVLYSETLGNILGLAVSSESRRLGAGHLLMSAAEEWAKSKGAVGVRLNSSSTRTGAHKFYRRIGYTLEKEQIRFMKKIS